MTFGQAIRSCFSNYVGFRGRASRSEYWFWVLFMVILNLVTGFIDALAFAEADAGPTTLLANLATILPGLAVSVRRLHDTNRAGWWLLLWFVPLIGFIVLLIWYLNPGTKGDNDYGQDPLGPITIEGVAT